MTENSMFFSNGAWYTQVQFARFLKDIFSDGVCDGIDNELEVIANTPANMAVQVKTGRSYVQGYIHEILTDPVQLAIEASDPTNPRIDRVVLHLDVNSARSVIVKVLKGTASASPVAPTLTQTSSIWQISLAQVRVNANATVINSGNITDERTFMTCHRENLPLASTTEFGAVKVGSGVNVTNGVITVPQRSNAPIYAKLQTTNEGVGILINNNTYLGTIGIPPLGFQFTNAGDTTAKSITANCSFSHPDTGTHTESFTLYANNCLTGAKRTLASWSIPLSYGDTTSRTANVTIALEETITLARNQGGSSINGSLSLSTQNNTYIGAPV